MDKLREVETAATQRLRKTFKYPSESDDEDAVEAGMDEQDRTALLHTLSAHDTSTTHTYTLLLLALPLLPILLYLPRLFSLSTLPLTLLAITSLLASAYTLYFLPLPPTKFQPDGAPPRKQDTKVAAVLARDRAKATAKGLYKPTPTPTPSWDRPSEQAVRRPVPYISEGTADILADYVVPVNRAVCGALALYEVWLGREWNEGFTVGGGYLPGLICFLVLWARTELRIIDMDALERMGKGEGSGKGR